MKLGAFVGSLFSSTAQVTKGTLNSVGSTANLLSNEIEAFESKREVERTTDLKITKAQQGGRYIEALKELDEQMNSVNVEQLTASLEASVTLQQSVESKLDSLLKL